MYRLFALGCLVFLVAIILEVAGILTNPVIQALLVLAMILAVLTLKTAMLVQKIRNWLGIGAAVADLTQLAMVSGRNKVVPQDATPNTDEPAAAGFDSSFFEFAATLVAVRGVRALAFRRCYSATLELELDDGDQGTLADVTLGADMYDFLCSNLGSRLTLLVDATIRLPHREGTKPFVQLIAVRHEQSGDVYEAAPADIMVRTAKSTVIGLWMVPGCFGATLFAYDGALSGVLAFALAHLFARTVVNNLPQPSEVISRLSELSAPSKK